MVGVAVLRATATLFTGSHSLGLIRPQDWMKSKVVNVFPTMHS